MSRDFEKYAKELSDKVEHIPPYDVHMMEKDGYLDRSEMLAILGDLQSFLDNEVSNLPKYEQWLEDNGGTDKTR